MTYPLIVLFVSVCASTFIYITFSDLRNQDKLPNTTDLTFTPEDYAISLGMLLFGLAYLAKLIHTRTASNKTHPFYLPIWSIQACNRLGDTFQSMAFMLACGIPMLEAVTTLREQFIHTWKGTPWIGKQLACLHSDIESGYPLMRTMELLRWPRFAISLATIAEQTGDLPNLFEQLARIYYQQAEIRQTHLLQWTGPITLCLSAALLIGSYLYSIWPLYASINDMVQ
jgi:type II secretory pathway component PulF